MDEVTFCEYEVDDTKKPIAWISYSDMMQRGHPSSLVLHQFPTKTTSRRSPGPGPIDMKTWQQFAERCIRGKQMVIHTDSARPYRTTSSGMHADTGCPSDQVHRGSLGKPRVCSHWSSRSTIRPKTCSEGRNTMHRRLLGSLAGPCRQKPQIR